jgi:hypothetical protein
MQPVRFQIALSIVFVAAAPVASDNQFVTVDETPSTPLRACWTTDGMFPWEPCTNGNPAIRAIGLGLQIAPTLADFRDVGPGIRILTDIPDGSGTMNVDYTGPLPGSTVLDSVQVVEPSNPIPICSSPGLLPFSCQLSPAQRAMMERSELLILIEPRIRATHRPGRPPS